MNPLLLVLGGFALIIVLGAGIAIFTGGRQTVVDERLEEFVSSTGVVDLPEDDVVDRSAKKSDVADKLDNLMSGRTFFGSIQEKIRRADIKLRVSEYIVFMAIATLVGAGAGYFFFGQSWIVAAIGGIVGSRVPRFYISYTAKSRVRAFNNQLGDTLTLWVNALRAGSSVLQGMETIATESPPPISVEFERVVQEVRLGLSVEQSLANMYNRVPSDDLDLVITAVNIQREVGGNLAEVLDSISFTIRERVRIKGEIRTLTAQGRASGWIITFLPIALGLMMYFINPEYISELWVKEQPWIIPGSFPCGWLVLICSVAMIGAGAFAISKIVDIEV
ncbi:MAG: type II secretion system F family protein [Ardenticatenaceae bacterium]|nr:type II secretion system F family protein [Ardenticatenaceae bacterium]